MNSSVFITAESCRNLRPVSGKTDTRKGNGLLPGRIGLPYVQNAADNGSVPFISRNFSVLPVRTVEPPVTNPAMATMITGELPDVHGIHSRKDREVLVPTLFAGRSGEKYSIFRGGYQDFEDRTSAQASCCGKGKRLRLLDLPGCVQSGFGGKRIYFCPFS